MRIQLIDESLGKDGALIVPSLERLGLDTLVPAGATIDVPDDVAGAGPHWRQPAAGDDLAYLAATGLATLDEHGGIKTVHDLGRGLLAQTTTWGRAPEAKKTDGKSI